MDNEQYQEFKKLFSELSRQGCSLDNVKESMDKLEKSNELLSDKVSSVDKKVDSLGVQFSHLSDTVDNQRLQISQMESSDPFFGGILGGASGGPKSIVFLVGLCFLFVLLFSGSDNLVTNILNFLSNVFHGRG